MLLSLIIGLAIIVGTTALFLRCLKKVCASTQTMVGIAFGAVAATALAVGVWFGVFGEFRLNERVRMQGAPVPLVVFVLEGQNWTDFVKPLPVGYVCMVANALFPVGVFGLLWMLFSKRLVKSQPPEQNSVPHQTG